MDAETKAHLDAIVQRADRHEAGCDRRADDQRARDDAQWQAIDDLRKAMASIDRRIWLLLIGVALLLGGEAGIFAKLLDMAGMG